MSTEKAQALRNISTAIMELAKCYESDGEAESETDTLELDAKPPAPKKKRSRRTKAQIEADKKKEAQLDLGGSDDEDDINLGGDDDVLGDLLGGDDPDYTLEDIRSTVQRLIAANKRKQAVKLLASFKAKSINELKESDYATFMAGALDELEN
jgi:hypothetical protein